MACGTPVIAWDAGSTREVVDEGVTGWIVGSMDQAVAAVGPAQLLSRSLVRRTFERRFSAATMSKNYLRLYTRLARSGLASEESTRSLARPRAAAAHGAVRA
jgi:glycosyltransferase involved in cell wall biosynthesis